MTERDPTGPPGTNLVLSSDWLMPVFGLLLMVFGAWMSYQAFQLHSDASEADQWIPVECRIVRAASLVDDEDASISLTVRYAYQFKGRDHESSKVIIAPDSIRIEDSSWTARRIAEWTDDTVTTCFVNPDEPSEAVLDRRHSKDAAKAFTQISTFVVILGIGMCLAAAKGRSTQMRTRVTWQDFAVQPDRPRSLDWLPQLSVLVGGLAVLWLFVVALMFVFIAFDGKGQIQDWLFAKPRDQTVSGKVVYVRKVDARVFGEPYYEVGFSFRPPPTESQYFGHSVMLWEHPSIGDSVEVEFHQDQLEEATIVGHRRTTTPRWVGVAAMLLAMMFLLVYPLRTRYRLWRLLKHGTVVPATKAGSRQVKKEGWRSAYTFSVGDATYTVNFSEALSDGQIRQRSKSGSYPDQVDVLYDPKSPSDNTAVPGCEHYLDASLNAVRLLHLYDISIPCLGIAAVVVLIVIG